MLQPTLAAVRRLTALAALVLWAVPAAAQAPEPAHAGGEAALVLPDLHQATFLGGIDGHRLLVWGLVVCALGLLFGLTIYTQLKNLPVHQAMREISELIYETCKTYLVNQGKFLLV
ncbi:MAG: sodium-translocating pyrophosphatase, partial [Gemmatimonadota bacterium]